MLWWCIFVVQYKLSEDPKLLMTGVITLQGDCRVSLSPDARIVAVAVNSSIFMYSTASGDQMETLENVHRGEECSGLHAVAWRGFNVGRKPLFLPLRAHELDIQQ